MEGPGSGSHWGLTWVYRGSLLLVLGCGVLELLPALDAAQHADEGLVGRVDALGFGPGGWRSTMEVAGILASLFLVVPALLAWLLAAFRGGAGRGDLVGFGVSLFALFSWPWAWAALFARDDSPPASPTVLWVAALGLFALILVVAAFGVRLDRQARERRIAAGWYQDPQRRAAWRWWDGSAWTEWVS